MSALSQAKVPADRRALVAVDLGAESCRVSLLRWIDGKPDVQLVHRFSNGPVHHEDGSLRWPLEAILAGVDQGMRLCADRAPEGVRSVAVDGWAVDYVRVDSRGQPLAAPFCYRDERTINAERQLHERISQAELRRITGLQLQQINTLYQLYADNLAGVPTGERWLNPPEYLLSRWGGLAVAEFTNASHTQMLQLEDRCWSREILEAAGINPLRMPQLVPPGTRLGQLDGELAALPAFHMTELMVPACHDTASAIAGIPAAQGRWGYISSGTWSLAGTILERPCTSPNAATNGFTNLGAAGESILFQKNMNGMWLLKQCMDDWAAEGGAWSVAELCNAAAKLEAPLAPGATHINSRSGQVDARSKTLEPIFHPDSYGYRPGRSAKQAIAVTRKRCWQYDWVVEFDIKAAFDQIDHGLLLKAVRTHIKEGWILLYIERWLTAPFETAEGEQLPRERGTPQGGVVSPILMNL